jgi:hypothetical protein
MNRRSRMGYITIPMTRLEGWTKRQFFYNTAFGLVAESYGTTPFTFRGSTGHSQTACYVTGGAHDEYLCYPW